MKIINNIFMIVILYSILIFFDKISEKKELDKNDKIKTVIAILLIINFFCFFVGYSFLYFINFILIFILFSLEISINNSFKVFSISSINTYTPHYMILN